MVDEAYLEKWRRRGKTQDYIGWALIALLFAAIFADIYLKLWLWIPVHAFLIELNARGMRLRRDSFNNLVQAKQEFDAAERRLHEEHVARIMQTHRSTE